MIYIIYFLILIAANVVLMVILNGMGTVTGPIVGTIIFIAFNELILSYLGATELNLYLLDTPCYNIIIFSERYCWYFKK